MNKTYRVEVVFINVQADNENAAWGQVEGELGDRTALDFEMVSVEEESWRSEALS